MANEKIFNQEAALATGESTIRDCNTAEDTLSFADLLDAGLSGLDDDLLSFAETIKVTVSVDGHDLILTVPNQDNPDINAVTTITLANLGGDYPVDSNTTLADLMNPDLAHPINVDTCAS